MRRTGVRSPRPIPCTAPPWGTLAAVDISTGEVAWEVPLGSTPEASSLPPIEGWPNAGGPIVTATGLVFIAATTDQRIRAFDVESGEELWHHRLPRAGIATPMTYEHDGRQYVVIAAGGHGGWGLAVGDYVVAFALPDN